ncbi:MAG: transcription elongation factor GreA [Campylobacterales bacterium]|nr:transcription elongation factor GreA [Campylobacterales bacterium]
MTNSEPMTKYGFQKISDELNYLKSVERIANAKEIEHAVELGDLKENAEYHAAKERQVQIDSRIEELTALIGKAQIVDPAELEHARISFGSTVVLCELESDEEVTYTIVGGFESNPSMGLISFNSPLAKQMLGREEGDQFKAKLPGGVKEYEVVEVKYQEIVFESHH